MPYVLAKTAYTLKQYARYLTYAELSEHAHIFICSQISVPF
jgi:hypothetical protein